MRAAVNTLATTRPEVMARSLAIPWFIYAVLFGSTSIIMGLQWDISWHMSIGRDTFWSPPHLAIYLGGIVAGLASGWVVLRTTFAGGPALRAQSVRLWGFYGPLGAFTCIWGAFAMVTSAPFDDWWHNTYGLDTKILSPPHAVLAAGVAVIQLGAMLSVLALQNRNEEKLDADRDDPVAEKRRAWLRAMYIYAAGILLVANGLMAAEYMPRILMHSSIFYQVVCGVFPLTLVAAARGSRLRWPATATALVYMGLVAAMVWILPLFPAEPKLGPIRQHVTHMVPLSFPLLIIFPAIAIDVLMRRMGHGRDGRLALYIGLTFFIVILAVQWPFGNFLLSPYARNWIFSTHRFAYYMPSQWYIVRHEFAPWDANHTALLRGLAFAIPLAVVTARIGLWWGNWMRRVQR